MNSCCTVFHIDPDEVGVPVTLENEECTGCDCHCGYIQFETLAPYLTKLTNNNTLDENHLILEARVRQQIVEISRLFDAETKVEAGTYSKAHYKIIKLYGNGTRYLKIPEFVPNTLELYTDNGYLINPDSYTYKDGFLILNPCQSHTTSCGCTGNCGIYEVYRNTLGWRGCLQAKAKFGKECADYAVQLAVRSYLIEYNTFGDQKEATYQGYAVSRGFKIPHSWSTLVQKYLENKKIFNQFGFA